MRAVPLLLLSLGLAGIAVPARAGPAEQKAAEALTRLVMSADQYDRTIAQMTTQMMAAARAGGQKMPADAEKVFGKVIRESLPYEDMVRWTAEVYGKHFSLAEIKDLTKFYQTPTGKKLSSILPEIMGEVGRKTADVIPQRLPAAMKKYGLGPPGAP